MKNAKSNIETKIEQLTHDAKNETTTKNDDIAHDAILTCANVARELNIDPKRARAFLRKNVELYVARHQRFTRESTLYKKTYDALLQYKNSRKIITQ